MAPLSGLNEYKQVQIGTAEQGKLILMLYDGAIASLNRAAEALRQGDHVVKGQFILKAQDILLELLAGLDLEAGELAVNLQSLYLFMYRHLNEANLRKSEKHIQEVLRILGGLREAWGKAVDQVSREGTSVAEARAEMAVVA